MLFSDPDTGFSSGTGSFREILGYGEPILWQGRPERYSLLEKQDWFLLPFSILWGGFAVFWEYSAFRVNAPLLFKLWGIPFVLVGLYMIAGRFLCKRYTLRHTVYAITDRRIIRKVGKRVDILLRSALPEMRVEYKDGGFGTIRFQSSEERRRYALFYSADTTAFSLVGLSDVRKALAAIETMCQNGTE